MYDAGHSVIIQSPLSVNLGKIVTMALVAAQATWISMAQGIRICFRWLLRLWASTESLVVTVAMDITPRSQSLQGRTQTLP